jgi:molybdopterin molybdotransferase
MAEKDASGSPQGSAAAAGADLSALLSVRQAIEVIDGTPVYPRIERLPLAAARGYRLAQDVIADRDYPPFAKSMMDGFAVRSADLKALKPPVANGRRDWRGENESAPAVELKVVGEVAAGQLPDRPVGPGEAMAIMTGAPVPDGADAVVPIEDVQGAGGKTWGIGTGGVGGGEPPIRLTRPNKPGDAIARQGSDCTAGAVVLTRGVEMQAAQIAAAATVGAAEVDVFARPRVGVLSTGDELAPVGETPGAAQIRNSNNLMLIALLQRMGCEVTNLGTAPDEPKLIRRALEQGMRLDALFVTGGMSMGAYDYVPRILREMGVELKVTKVRIKPGKPFVFGVLTRPAARGVGSREEENAWGVGSGDVGGKDSADLPVSSPSPLPTPQSPNPTSPLPASYVFGLPGNPVSAFVCTVRLASRLLARLSGGEPGERWITGRLESGLPANGPREFYLPVVRHVPAGGTSAKSELSQIRPLQWKGSADLFTLAAANALLIRGENEPPVPQGTMVRVLEI